VTNVPGIQLDSSREVLFSHDVLGRGTRWLFEIEDRLRPTGLVVSRADTGQETFRRVERGGLAAAVLIADAVGIDGLSILRVIRTIDQGLPCWLVTGDTTRRTLEAALSLGVTSVMSPPVEVERLTLSLKRTLIRPIRGN